MNVDFDFSNSEDGEVISEITYHSVFDFLSRRKFPIGLLTIKNAQINRKFLQKWRKSTDGFRTTVIHVTFEECDFRELEPLEICNFLFRYIRCISMKIEGKVDFFLKELLIDERITRLHNVRIYSRRKIQLEDDIVLRRLFEPGELVFMELRKIRLSPEFVNKLIQKFRESTRSVHCISRLCLGGDIPWPLHQLNFSKEKVQTGDRDKYKFQNRFGYYTLNVEYGNNELDMRIDECF
ncbi:hypothetical protein FO519_006239 [Halicephalobus sp. NKZ332]|nr:hypothetical protein FO519_006239 [Halicephalobus sp. NKZ332]